MSDRVQRKICHMVSTAEGATWMLEQLRELRDEKHWDVTAIIGEGEGPLADKLRAERIRVLTFNFDFPTGLAALWLLPKRVWSLAAVLRRERFSVVQTHLFQAMILGRLASWLADVPVRLAMVASPYHLEAQTPRWIDRDTSWMETAILPSCEYTRSLYLRLGIADERLHVVYYGPDEKRFSRENVNTNAVYQEFGCTVATPLIGMVAYFYFHPANMAVNWIPPILQNEANKRQEDLIRAMPFILKEFPDARLLLVGSGWESAGQSYMDRMKQLAASLGLQDRVIFTGYRQDVNSILATLHVAVQASLVENLGGTIESLLMECPTVATRTGGMIDTIQDGVTGVLIEPLDIAAMTSGILRLLRDRPWALSLARTGRALMLERFTLGQTIQQLDSLYTDFSQRHSVERHYRTWVQALRVVSALPLFAYLGLHLAWDYRNIICNRFERRSNRVVR
jgi:glycosyltransferase involved in cell wall biosynthesis